MKYFKYAKVDSVTGISVCIESSENGPYHPVLPGLSVKFEREFVFATADDSAIGDPANFIFELSQTEFFDEIKHELALRKQDYIRQCDMVETNIRNAFMSTHPSELAAAAFKVPEAKDAIAAETDEVADTVAPHIKAEAIVRGITTKEMAQKVIDKFNAYMAAEAQVSGVSGKKRDAIKAINFDESDPFACLDEFGVLVDTTDVDPFGQPLKRQKYDLNSGWPDF